MSDNAEVSRVRGAAMRKKCVECCCLVQVLWNKQRGPEALSRLLYGTVESGGLGLIPPVDTAKGM